MSSFGPSASKHLSTVGRSHSFHKTVLISSFSFRWLKRSLTHCFVSLNLVEYLTVGVRNFVIPKPSANIQRFFLSANSFSKIFLIHFITFAIANYK
jgi:hypothetical protein